MDNVTLLSKYKSGEDIVICKAKEKEIKAFSEWKDRQIFRPMNREENFTENIKKYHPSIKIFQNISQVIWA